MRRLVLYVSGVLVFGALVIGGYLYLGYRGEVKEKNYEIMATGAVKAFNNGDYATQVATFSDLVTNAPNADDKGRYSIYLAASLYRRGGGTDQRDALQLLDEIATNDTYSPAIRATALNQISVYLQGQNLDFYDKEFSGSSIATLPPVGTDQSKMLDVYAQVLQRSDKTYANSYAKYALAGSYYAVLATSTNPYLSEKMLTYVKEGDALNDQSLYSPSFLASAQYYKALGLFVGAWAAGTTTSSALDLSSNTETAFKSAILLSEPAQAGFVTATRSLLNLKARFYYATFLVAAGNRKDDIVQVLRPFGQVDVSRQTDLDFFRRLKANGSKGNNPFSLYAATLAKISPDFSTFYNGL